MRWLVVLGLGLVGCRSAPRPAPPVIGDRGGGPADQAAPPVPSGLPCGVASVDDLEPYGRTRLGWCEVVDVGGDWVEARDHGRAVVRSGEAKPRIALDPRVPGPLGVRVGMTGADIRAHAPDHPVIECAVFGQRLQCEIRRRVEPVGCGDDAEDQQVYVEFATPPGLADGELPPGTDRWALVRDLPVAAVVLAMPC